MTELSRRNVLGAAAAGGVFATAAATDGLAGGQPSDML